jgi:probable phosphoglycerate mutase
LLPEGEDKVRQTASVVFGAGRLIDPAKLAAVICSPRQRARRTLDLLLEQLRQLHPATVQQLTTTTEDIAEWGYGDYEGLLTGQIRDLRRQRGLDSEGQWDIWRDGCEGPTGESSAQVTERLDRLIGQITAMQGAAMQPQSGAIQASASACDVLVVAHGHILRAFVKRWLGFPLDARLEMMLEPGGVCGLSYAHGNVDERAVLVGMSFPAGGC